MALKELYYNLWCLSVFVAKLFKKPFTLTFEY